MYLAFGKGVPLIIFLGTFPCGSDIICSASKPEETLLYDHRPHQLFEDDYIRVCQIPRRKV